MNKKPQLKIGDMIANMAKALHIPHCEKCEQRRLILNEVKSLGIGETIKKLRAIGAPVSSKHSDEKKSIEEVISKLTDCCKD
jgi:hypothetical protein